DGGCPGTAPAPPSPAGGERVGVGGRIHDSERLRLEEAPPHPDSARKRAKSDLSPHAGRGEELPRSACGVPSPTTPFFRFPGFAASPVLLDRLAARGIVVFGADFWASDWNRMSPSHQLRLTLARLEARGGRIVLFHDTKAQTAAMLPAFLRALHARGFRVVHG